MTGKIGMRFVALFCVAAISLGGLGCNDDSAAGNGDAGTNDNINSQGDGGTDPVAYPTVDTGQDNCFGTADCFDCPAEVAALYVEVFEEPTPSRPDAGGVPVAVDLTDGGRVRGSLVELAETGCRMRVVGETEILLPLARILEIAVDDGRLRFLSDLAPGTETGRGSPFGDELGMSWPYRIDRAAGGRALVAGGRRWARGIGMHAPSRVAWTLEPQWRRLRGFVAIDDRSLLHEPDARGSVVFRILVGGETVWESPVVRGGDDPLEIPALELGNADGARELVLEVDSVEDFRGDRADWLRLILVGD